MENLLDWLRLGKIPLNRSLMTVLFDSHELLTSLIRMMADGDNISRTNEIAACVARINAFLAPPEKTAGVSPLKSLDLPDHIIGALTEYEEHRLLDNLGKGRNLYNVHTSFDLNTFDVELAAVTDTLKNCGEVISTLPSVGGNMETHIDFEILFGSIRQLGELLSLIHI